LRTILLSLAALMATPGLLVVPLSDTEPATAQQTVTIEAGSDYFCDPSFFGAVCETIVSVGDTVTWNNVQGVHTVTECDTTHTVCPPEGGGFDSGIMTQGATFSHAFPDPGTFNYYCAIHPDTMQGRIVVLQVTPTPAPTAPPTVAPTGAPTAVPTQPGSTAPAATAPVVIPSTGGPPESDHGQQIAQLALVAGALALAIAAATTGSSFRKR
jgi:plastocyanin